MNLLTNPMLYCIFVLSCVAGLLVDLVKEAVQAAANGTSWCLLRSYQPAPALSAAPSTNAIVILTDSAAACSTAMSPAAEAAAATAGSQVDVAGTSGWLQSLYGADDPETVRSLPRKLLKPVAKTGQGAVGDIDDMKLVVSKKRSLAPKGTSQQQHGGLGEEEEEDIFVDLRTDSTDLGPEKLIEVREAVPFTWVGTSPFWSPLMVRRALLEPLRELAQRGTAEQVMKSPLLRSNECGSALSTIIFHVDTVHDCVLNVFYCLIRSFR